MTSSPSTQDLPELFLSLAPSRLRNYRHPRYLGDGLCVEMDELVPRDQELLRELYKKLSALLFTIADINTDDDAKWKEVEGWSERYDLDAFITEVREIGLATHEHHASEAVAKAMHDIRGGALSSLVGRLQMLGVLPRNPKNLNVLFVQTRDHLKIMRNVLVGLDEPRRNADRSPKAHAMQLMLDKWQESLVGPNWRQRLIGLHIDCRYEGPLTECCLESAAIDRIFYNLTNNAARHAADEHLDMVIFPLPEPLGDECLRFVLSNQVSEEDADRLRGQSRSPLADSADLGTGRSLFDLFEPEVSSTGSGFGLTVVADFVAGAFGLKDRTEALRQRYVGAILDGRTFRVWFHWPMAHEGLPAKLDDYHRPEQSLSEP